MRHENVKKTVSHPKPVLLSVLSKMLLRTRTLCNQTKRIFITAQTNYCDFLKVRHPKKVFRIFGKEEEDGEVYLEYGE